MGGIRRAGVVGAGVAAATALVAVISLVSVVGFPGGAGAEVGAVGVQAVGVPPCGPVTGHIVFLGDDSFRSTEQGGEVVDSVLQGDRFWVEAKHRSTRLPDPSTSSGLLRTDCTYNAGGIYATLFTAVSGGIAAVTSPGTGTAQITVWPYGIWGNWIETVTSTGAVYGGMFNAAPTHLAAPMVGIESSPDGYGYWTVAADGGVFTYGDAGFHGSTGDVHLAAPIVGMTDDPSTGGYWLVGSDGGVFSFDAPFYGSTGAIHLSRPIVGMAATPDGRGYWLVGSDGGVFAFGDARFYGSVADVRLAAPVVGIAPTADGRGYWLDGSDGGVFTFGDAPFFGDQTNPVAGPVHGPVLPTPDDRGYWLSAPGPACDNFGITIGCVTAPSACAGYCGGLPSWVGATELPAREQFLAWPPSP